MRDGRVVPGHLLDAFVHHGRVTAMPLDSVLARHACDHSRCHDLAALNVDPS